MEAVSKQLPLAQGWKHDHLLAHSLRRRYEFHCRLYNLVGCQMTPKCVVQTRTKQINELSIKKSINMCCNSHSLRICGSHFFPLIPVFSCHVFICRVPAFLLQIAQQPKARPGFYCLHSASKGKVLQFLAIQPFSCALAIIVTQLSNLLRRFRETKEVWLAVLCPTFLLVLP